MSKQPKTSSQQRRIIFEWVTFFVSATLLVILLKIKQDLAALFPSSTLSAVETAEVVIAGLLGIYAARQLTHAVFRHAKSPELILWREPTRWFMYVIVALFVASALGINLSGFLLGGAIVGVVAATAAQTTLSNLLSGLVLLLSRPIRANETIYIRSWMFGGQEYEGTVVKIGTFFTTLKRDSRLMLVPNNAIAASVIVLQHGPLQAEFELELAPGTDPQTLIEFLKRELELDGKAQIIITPLKYSANDSLLTCKVQVRSKLSVDKLKLTQALIKANESLSDKSSSIQPNVN
jgi:small-conductance mechanosensitive channel